MATRFTGPVQNAEKSAGAREWYSNMAIGAGSDPSYVTYFNDFLFSRDYAAADWVVTETQAAATEAIAADELNGALLLTNSAADDDIVQIQSAEEWFKLSSGKRAWFECKFKVSDATESDFFVGFSTTDTTPLVTTDCVGFRKADDAASVVSITEDNTTETTNTAYTCVSDTYKTVGFYWDGISKVKFFVDRSLTATHTANIEQTNQLALVFNLQNGEAVAKTMTIDYVFACVER